MRRLPIMKSIKHNLRHFLFIPFAFGLLAERTLAGPFTVGPDYRRPSNSVPAAYKATELGAWKEGRPLDTVPKGNWWRIFEDPTLDELEQRAVSANQNLKAAIARVEQARATARVA